MEVEQIKEKAKDLTDNIAEYAETFYKLSVVKATQKATQIGSAVIASIATVILGLFILFFGGVALALWLGDLVNSRPLGFVIVAGFFLIVLVIIIALRKNIVFPYFRNLLIRKFYD
jgi:cytochrome c biogenesis protein CcdA